MCHLTILSRLMDRSHLEEMHPHLLHARGDARMSHLMVKGIFSDREAVMWSVVDHFGQPVSEPVKPLQGLYSCTWRNRAVPISPVGLSFSLIGSRACMDSRLE